MHKLSSSISKTNGIQVLVRLWSSLLTFVQVVFIFLKLSVFCTLLNKTNTKLLHLSYFSTKTTKNTRRMFDAWVDILICSKS